MQWDVARNYVGGLCRSGRRGRTHTRAICVSYIDRGACVDARAVLWLQGQRVISTSITHWTWSQATGAWDSPREVNPLRLQVVFQPLLDCFQCVQRSRQRLHQAWRQQQQQQQQQLSGQHHPHNSAGMNGNGEAPIGGGACGSCEEPPRVSPRRLLAGTQRVPLYAHAPEAVAACKALGLSRVRRVISLIWRFTCGGSGGIIAGHVVQCCSFWLHMLSMHRLVLAMRCVWRGRMGGKARLG